MSEDTTPKPDAQPRDEPDLVAAGREEARSWKQRRAELNLAAPAPLPESVGPYKIIRRLGAGGMGVVYEAEQAEPSRRVAVKVIRAPVGADTDRLRLFQREIQVLGRLRHPGVAQIYDAGRTKDGQQYFVMELVDGRPLVEFCEQADLSLRDRLALFAEVCKAVQYAHQRGVIHRDLKPANILVDEDGKPHVLDFGLARIVDPDVDATRTLLAGKAFIGTLPYMSPEQTQADPGDLDVCTDVYSLGVILYEMLTGTYPYRVAGQMAEVLRNIAEAEPKKPSTIRRQINDEIETIVLKTLSKERERRYQSAETLAQDVDRYLNGEPIDAKRDSGLYVLKKQLKRYRVPVAIVAVFIVMVTGSAIVFWILLGRADEQRVIAETKTVEALKARSDEQSQRKIAEAKTKEAEEKAEDLRRALYRHRITSADAAYGARDMIRMRKELDACPADLRGWEWGRLLALSDRSSLTLRGHGGLVQSVAFSPDGKRIVSGGGLLGRLKIWDVRTGEETLTLRGHGGLVQSVAFSPDGTRIASGGMDNTVKVWDAQTGEKALTMLGHLGCVSSVAFSPDGKRIVSGGQDQALGVWDAQTGEEILRLPGHSGWVRSVAFSPDGKRIASGSNDGTLKVWDAQTGEELLTLRGHSDWVSSVAFSPDGKRIVSGSSDSTLKVWDAQTGQEILTLRGHTGEVNSVAFSPDGRRIVSVGVDQTLGVWDAQTGEELLTLRGHSDNVGSVAFSPDGKRIVSGSLDGTLRIWDAQTGGGTLTLRGHSDWVSSVAFSPDGRRVVSGGYDKTLKIWDAEIGEEALTLNGHSGRVDSVTFSPDGKRIVSGSGDNTLKVWDAQTGGGTLTLRGHSDRVGSVAFSPDGKRIVSGSSDNTLKVWDAQTGEELLTLRGHSDRVGSVAFSPDGRRIVSGSLDGTLKVWDAQTGQEKKTLSGHTMWTVFVGRLHLSFGRAVAFSPDGRRIVSGSRDNTLKVWDAQTGEETLTLRGHSESVGSVSFSPNGRRIVSGSDDETLKIWDAQTGEETLTLRGHSGGVSSVAFSPDGRRILSGSSDGMLKIWDSASIEDESERPEQ